MALDSHLYRDPMLIVQERQERDRKKRARQESRGGIEAFSGDDVQDPDRLDFRFRISTQLNDRLENWGWLSRDRKPQGVSMTGIICHRLAQHAGAYKYDGPLPPTDEQRADALLIERAWRNSLLPMRQKTLLAGYYVYRVRPEKLARIIPVRLREFDSEMYRACTMIDNIAHRLARVSETGNNKSTIQPPVAD